MRANPSLRVNIAALGLLQVANYGLVLLSLPYLTSTLGPETWGNVVFVQTVANYGTWVSNWGFYLSATREISEHRHDPARVAAVFRSTWYAQLLLSLACAAVIVGCAVAVPAMRAHLLLYGVALGIVLGNALTPVWLLNGLERLSEGAIFQVASKVIATPLFFLLVHGPEQAWRYFAITSASAVLVGGVAWRRMRRYGGDYAFPGFRLIFDRLREGWVLFVSGAWGNFYGTIPTFVLGAVSGPAQLGLFNVADRVRGAATTVVNPISHSLFPRMCHLYATDLARARHLLVRTGLALAAMTAAFSAGIWWFADRIPQWIGGAQYAPAAGAMRWLALVPFVTTLSAFGVHQILIPAQQAQVYHRLITATALFAAAAAYPFIAYHGAVGAAQLVVTAECVFLALVALVVVKNRFYLVARA